MEKITSEQVGQEILNFYGGRNIQSGQMLMFQDILTYWSNKVGSSNEDLMNGLEWLTQQGYIEQQNGKNNMFFLTDAGFATI